MPDYYVPTGVPVNNSGPDGTAAAMQGEFALIKTQLSDRLPIYTGNGGKLCVINAGETASVASKVSLTEPATSATLTLANLSSLVTVGAFSTTLTATATTTLTLPVTGTLATLAGVEVLSGKTLTAPVIGAATGTSLSLSGGITATGGVLTSPSLVAPALGTPTSCVATNFTGTATALNIGGIAATATTATTATNQSGGTVAATTIAASSSILSSSATAGIGYATGAGGVVTQLTSKGTAVTLNKRTGYITLHNAALAGGAEVSFTLTNSALIGGDFIIFQQNNFTMNTYTIRATVFSGSATVTLKNITAGSLSEALEFQFITFRAVNS